MKTWMELSSVSYKGSYNGHYEIHPDDIEIAKEFKLGFVQCIGQQGDYLLTRNLSGKIIRVKGNFEMFIRPTPEFLPDDKVREIERPEVTGTISEMEWHFEEKKYCYKISIAGKKKKRRYFSDELISMT
jgi:uncharacterized membrane protein YkoI